MSCAFCDGAVGHPGHVTSYNDYIREVEYVWNSLESAEWRRGQTFMNVLGRVNPELYDEASQTAFDCFHDDKRIDDLLDFLQARMTP